MKTKKYNIKKQADAIKHFIMQMDIEMIEAFLLENHTYQKMDKKAFLSKLERLFNKFKKAGDTELYAYDGNCNNCYIEKSGFTYVGNVSFNYISIIVDIEKGTITDMFECSDFKNKKQSLILNKKYYLNDFITEMLSYSSD